MQTGGGGTCYFEPQQQSVWASHTRNMGYISSKSCLCATTEPLGGPEKCFVNRQRKLKETFWFGFTNSWHHSHPEI